MIVFRVTIVCAMCIMGALLCIDLANNMQDVVDKRNDKLCQIQPSYCK